MDKQRWGDEYIFFGRQTVLMSCHAGDYGQRALCNIIGDQPLFYIEDSATEDMELDELFKKIDHLEAQRDQLQKQIGLYDSVMTPHSAETMSRAEDRFDLLFAAETQKLTLDQILETACASGSFRSYYDCVIRTELAAITLDTRVEGTVFDSERKTITVNPHQALTEAATGLLTAMRQAFLYDQSAELKAVTMLQPQDAILVNRLIMADCDSLCAAFYWDMRLAGYHDIWAQALTGADYDLCAAYAMEAMMDFRALQTGQALRATVEKWFMSARCKGLDRKTVQVLMAQKDKEACYGELTSFTLLHDMIRVIGSRPAGENYLMPIISAVLSDSIFRDVRDRSTANFLWFVTFERRMADMEQELQIAADDVESTDTNILEFSKPKAKRKKKPQKDHKASVFFLDHFRMG